MPKANLLEEAVKFAADKHAGQPRKGTNLPYITHPMEATAVCASFTEDVEVLAAAVLHDVVEDANVPVGVIQEKFGARVAAIVAGVPRASGQGVRGVAGGVAQPTVALLHASE